MVRGHIVYGRSINVNLNVKKTLFVIHRALDLETEKYATFENVLVYEFDCVVIYARRIWMTYNSPSSSSLKKTSL